jgi:hypothetical protein
MLFYTFFNHLKSLPEEFIAVHHSYCDDARSRHHPLVVVLRVVIAPQAALWSAVLAPCVSSHFCAACCAVECHTCAMRFPPFLRRMLPRGVPYLHRALPTICCCATWIAISCPPLRRGVPSLRRL